MVFTKDLIAYIEEYFPTLKGRIGYEIRLNAVEVKIKKKSGYVSPIGVPQYWFHLTEKSIGSGSLFESAHYDKMSFVAVVNDKFREEFFKNQSPLGKKVKVGTKEYTIIGVLKK